MDDLRGPNFRNRRRGGERSGEVVEVEGACGGLRPISDDYTLLRMITVIKFFLERGTGTRNAERFERRLGGALTLRKGYQGCASGAANEARIQMRINTRLASVARGEAGSAATFFDSGTAGRWRPAED